MTADGSQVNSYYCESTILILRTIEVACVRREGGRAQPTERWHRRAQRLGSSDRGGMTMVPPSAGLGSRDRLGVSSSVAVAPSSL